MRTKFKILETRTLVKNKLLQVSEFLNKDISTIWKLYGSDFSNCRIAQFELDSLDEFEDSFMNEVPYGDLIYFSKENQIYVYQDNTTTTLIEIIKNDSNINIGYIYDIENFYLHVMFKVVNKLSGRYLGDVN